MDCLQYLRQLKPAEFDKYAPPRGVRLNAGQIRKLRDVARQLPQDRNMLLYFWRFLFEMDVKVIRRYAGIEYANGIIEAFRFACKHYLEIEKPISNAGLRPVFESLIPEYEMLLVSEKSGVCWFRDLALEEEIVHSAVSQSEQRRKQEKG